MNFHGKGLPFLIEIPTLKIHLGGLNVMHLTKDTFNILIGLQLFKKTSI